MPDRAPDLTLKDPSTSLEGWLRAADEVTDVLSAARGLPEAAAGLLRAIGGELACDAGTLWAPRASGDALEALHLWEERASAQGVERPRTRSRGEGLAGRAWSLRRPVWAQDLREPSSGAGERAGGVAIPVLYGDAFYGVLEVLRREPIPAREADRVAAAHVGKQVGQFVAQGEAFRAQIRARRELADLFENAPVGVHVLDREGRVLRANRALLDMLVRTRDEVVGRPWRDLHADPDAADVLLERLARSEPAGDVHDADVRMRCGDGSLRWVRLDANALRDEDGFVHVRAFARDVTALREAESLLRASDERHRRLVEGARDYALHALDREGRVTEWNSGAARLYGWEAAEIVGRDFSVSLPPEDRAEAAHARMLTLALDEREFRHEGWRLRKDGSRFWAEVVYAALVDVAGRPMGISQLTQDATARRRLDSLRRASAELEHENRAVVDAGRRNAALLRSVASAVGGPAAEVEEAAERLRRTSLEGTQDEALDALSAAAANLRRALGELDEAASEASPAAPGSAVPIDLLRLATEARDVLREAAVERRVRVEVDVDPALRGIVADPAQVRLVMFNYLSNAIRFNRERGRAALRVLPEGPSQFRIEVEDSGPGIAPEEVDRIFEGEAGDPDGPRGMGLLATQRVVEQQGGRVGVQSALGRGSVFFAVLPRAPAGAVSEPAPGGAAALPRRVLVVSTDPATRASLVWTLGQVGFEATGAPEAETALDIGRESAFDAVAVDLLLPATGACDLVARLRCEGASRDVGSVLAAVGTASGAACLPVEDLLTRPAPADWLFAALERLHAPRGRGATVLAVDGDLGVLQAVARTLEVLGYRARVELDGHAALRTCAEEPPAALLLSPLLRGMDPFSFLAHLRRSPGPVVPVILTIPRKLEEDQVEALLRAAEETARDRRWIRCIPARSTGVDEGSGTG